MQNVFRFLLAWMVVFAHLTEGVDATSHLGRFAVFGFYVLSGYLITLILNEVYAFRPGPFFLNRALRIYPVYWLIALATLVMILTFPDADVWKGTWAACSSEEHWLGNIFIFPFEFYKSNFRLVPPAWSVAVELLCYALLWLIIARHRVVAFAAVVLSALLHIWLYVEVPGLGPRYAPVQAALLPFSLGTSIYFLQSRIDKIGKQGAVTWLTLSLTVWIGNFCLAGASGGLSSANVNLYFYVNLGALCSIVAMFSHSQFRARANGLSKRLGDLAYPVFLLHWQVGFLISTLLLDGRLRGWDVFFVSAPAILVCAWVADALAARSLEKIRDRIRLS